MSFCNNIESTCDTYYKQTLVDCDPISLTTGLADGDYWFTIIDKFGKGHTNQYSVVAGVLNIDKGLYSDEFFNKYSGYFEIFAHSVEDNYTRLDLTIAATTYKGILFNFE